ncbi:MAG: hypothetical protein ABI854_06200 [Betaproteobacteria bacterium]
MGLMDILDKYANRTDADPAAAHQHFDEVAAAAPPDVLGKGLGDAFRADSTPPFGDMVSQMFDKSDPQQRAGVLNSLLHSIGPGLASVLGGGLLGRLAGGANGGVPQLTPEQASQLTPEQVRDIATRAEQHDPTVLDKVGGFYAQHPQLVKTLGTAAVAIALAGVSNRMRNKA